MPCRDYGSDQSVGYTDMKVRADMLARIACKAMQELETNGIVDLLILKDDEVGAWWGQHKEADRLEKERKANAQAEQARRIETKRQRNDLIARLTPEERKLLGIK